MAAQHASSTQSKSTVRNSGEGHISIGLDRFLSAILRLIYIPRSSDQHRVQGLMDTCFPRLKNVLRWVQLASVVLFGVEAGFEFFILIPKIGGPPPGSVLTMARSFSLLPLGAGLLET